MTQPSAPKQERGEQRRERIIEAAAAAFMEKGYGATSLDDIVREAGGSRRDIYAWFGNKEKLFGAVVKRECARVHGALGELSPDADDPVGVLTEMGTNLISVLLEPRVLNLFRVIVGESARFPELGQMLYESGPKVGHEQLARFLRHWRDRGLITVDDPDFASRLLIEMVKGDLQLRALFDIGWHPEPAELRLYVTRAVKLVMQGIGYRA